MTHNWAQISYDAPFKAQISKIKPLLGSKKSKIRWNHKRSFFKNTEIARLLGTELGTHNSQYGGYMSRLWNLMFWIGGISQRFSASSFCDFQKNYLLRFHRIFFLFDKSSPLIFQMCFMRRTIAYLCPNIIYFDASDFSERRSEEGMFLLTLISVYLGNFANLTCSWSHLHHGVWAHGHLFWQAGSGQAWKEASHLSHHAYVTGAWFLIGCRSGHCLMQALHNWWLVLERWKVKGRKISHKHKLKTSL